MTRYCIGIFAKYPSSDDVYAIMHLFRNDQDDIKIATATLLFAIKDDYQPNLPKERFNKLAESQTPEIKALMLKLTQSQ